jgi:hypothetical protein
MRVDWQITVFYVDTNGGAKVGGRKKMGFKRWLTD